MNNISSTCSNLRVSAVAWFRYRTIFITVHEGQGSLYCFLIIILFLQARKHMLERLLVCFLCLGLRTAITRLCNEPGVPFNGVQSINCCTFGRACSRRARRACKYDLVNDYWKRY